MTFEERYGMTREMLLKEVRLRQHRREEERLAGLAETYRQARIERDAAAQLSVERRYTPLAPGAAAVG